ncbi:hypothetical protein LCGC14_1795100 [marine sediment metagenome]|uniref:Uncharacterized protein n=1 Tax=marine sediment metagenome TaxID=412755 RepID=A0A0F9GRG3_9ZZZZ
MGKYSKVIAAVIGLAVTLAAVYGLDLEPYVATLTSVVTAAAVWFFPNT